MEIHKCMLILGFHFVFQTKWQKTWHLTNILKLNKYNECNMHELLIFFIFFLCLQMSGKRSHSFKCAVHHRDREVCSENDFHLLLEEPTFFKKMVHVIAMEVLTDERDRKYYADRYSCCPPPLFILLMTIIEVSAVLQFNFKY